MLSTCCLHMSIFCQLTLPLISPLVASSLHSNPAASLKAVRLRKWYVIIFSVRLPLLPVGVSCCSCDALQNSHFTPSYRKFACCLLKCGHSFVKKQHWYQTLWNIISDQHNCRSKICTVRSIQEIMSLPMMQYNPNVTPSLWRRPIYCCCLSLLHNGGMSFPLTPSSITMNNSFLSLQLLLIVSLEAVQFIERSWCNCIILTRFFLGSVPCA